MTKEDLESKFDDCFDDNTRVSEGGYGADATDKLGMWWAFEPVISEYAKQHALAFATYVTVDYRLSLHEKSPILTDEEIYNQFIEQQNKP